MAGAMRDPLVARDVLIGCAAGAIWAVMAGSNYLVTLAVTGVLPRVLTAQRPFLGAPHVLSEQAYFLVYSNFIALLLLFVQLVLRLLLRRE